MSKATWSEVEAWPRQVVVAERVGDASLLATTILAPCTVIKVTELLVQEGVLERRRAAQVEHAVLALTDVNGQ